MILKQLMLSAVPASCLVLSGVSIAPAPFSMITTAQADANLSVNFSFGTFYDRLEPHGSWVSYNDQYVFLPEHVGRDWRPYTVGHWVNTRTYGWYWVSAEPFGWATYHYGRWGYSNDIGWYWVPGRRWAPAWVAWSHGNDRVAWAPLPPRHGEDVDVNITIGDVPDYYWQAVPTSAFLSINLSNNIIRDRNEVRTVVQQNRPETVHIENNVVVNNVIQVNEIEQATKQKVKVLDEKPVTTPDAAGKSDANSIAVFNPEVKSDTNAKPQKPVEAQQVITDRKAKGVQPLDVSGDQSTTPAKDANGKTQPIPAGQPPAKAMAPADAKTTADVPGTTPDKNAAQPIDNTAPKLDSQGKVDNKSKDTTPAPVVKTPDTKAPSAVAPEPSKAKRDKAPVPQSNIGAGTATAPADQSKTKAGDTVAPKDAQKPKDAQPPKDAQQPKDARAPKDAQQPKDIKQKAQPQAGDQKPADPNAGKTMKKDEPGKAKCDPSVETCPPAQ